MPYQGGQWGRTPLQQGRNSANYGHTLIQHGETAFWISFMLKFKRNKDYRS